MSKTISLLKSRLRELESKLNELLHHHPHDDQTQAPSNTDLSEDIKQKIVFVKNLLSAEISSSPPSKPHHLQHLAQSIERLEEAFQTLDNPREFSYNQLEMGLSCSCTDSCINDNVEAVGEVVVADSAEQDELSEGLNKAMVEWKETKEYSQSECLDAETKYSEDDFLESFGHHGGLVIGKKGLGEEFGKDIVLRDDVKMRRQERILRDSNSNSNSAFGQICGAMACGVVVGMVLMRFIMIKFSYCFHFVDQPFITIPT